MNRKRRTITVIVLILSLSLGFTTNYSSARSKQYIKQISPKNKAIITITNKTVEKWWENPYITGIRKELSKPTPVTLKWKSNRRGSYIVKVSKKKNLSSARTFTTKKNYVKIYNLERNTKYYWRVYLKKSKLKSTKRYFKTKNHARIIYIPGVSNVRDIGGYAAENGEIIKQGRIYRSANLNTVTKDGKKELKRLKIKTDLDLRKPGEQGAGASSHAGLKYINISGVMYGDIFENKEQIAEEMKVFADKNNYPIIFHCYAGRDRTGTLAFLLNGLAGVSKANLYKDYKLTYLSKYSSVPERAIELNESFDKLYSEMECYHDAEKPLKENIRQYLLDAGLTQTQINLIKKQLLK